MHSFRIRYIVLGLLVYIQSAYCRTCGSDFDDVVSRALLADVVVEGKVENFSQPGLNGPNVYNATFSVKQIIQGVLPKQGKRKKWKSLIVGDFGPISDKENCIAKVELGKTYILFLKPTDIDSNGLSRTSERDPSKSRRKRRPSVPFYKISGFPEKSSKRIKRQIRKQGCPNCAKAPKAKLTPKRVSAKLGEKVQIRCKTQGAKPTPVVRWFKNGQLLEKNRNIRIKNTKRGSRLRISKAGEEDAGLYKCVAANAAGQSTSPEAVVVIIGPIATTISPAPEHAVACERQSYCLNGGTCYQLPELNTTRFCKCRTLYTGRRCEQKTASYVTMAGPKTIESARGNTRGGVARTRTSSLLYKK